MTEKELDSYMFLVKELKSLEEQIDNISFITSIPFERIGSNPNYNTKSPQEINFVKYQELEEKKELRKNEILIRLIKIDEFIGGIRSDKIRLIVDMKYIKRMSWNAISEELHMCRRAINSKMTAFWEEEEKKDEKKQK